jgi:hypothetical protein
MAARFKVTDSKGNWMTLQLSENWLDYNGMWMPDTPGKVVASPYWENNPYEAENVNGVPYNANLYFVDSTQRKLWVMTLNTICGNILYEKSGSGFLLWSGARALIGGVISWKKL